MYIQDVLQYSHSAEAIVDTVVAFYFKTKGDVVWVLLLTCWENENTMS